MGRPGLSQSVTPEGEKQGPTQPERDHFLLGLEKSTKLNLRELIDRAGIGEPSPEAVPSDEVIKKLAAAARLGLSTPPDLLQGLKSPGVGTKAFAQWLRAFVLRAVGELLLWRATPMGVLSELFQVAALAGEDTFAGEEGFKVGVLYSASLREKTYSRTRASPLANTPGEFPRDLSELETQWRVRSEDVVTAARRALASGDPICLEEFAKKTSGVTYGSKRRCCLWYGLRKCTQKSCKREHECPFCGGAECGSKEGYVEAHLSKLKNPRSIVFASDLSGRGAGRPWARSRSPRRSPRRGPKGSGRSAPRAEQRGPR